MKKILTISTLILLTAACTQTTAQSNMMNPEQCKQACMKMMQGQGMMQQQGDMMKDCPMMKQMMQQQNMGAAQPTTPAPAASPEDHEKHHPK